MIEIIGIVIKTYLICWVAFSMIESLIGKIHKENIRGFLSQFLCDKCVYFWISLGITSNFYISAFISWIVYQQNKLSKLIK